MCSQFHSFYTLKKYISPNNGILVNLALRPKLLNSHFASFSLTNPDFLILQSAHFDCITDIPFFVVKVFEFNFSVFFLHFTQ